MGASNFAFENRCVVVTDVDFESNYNDVDKVAYLENSEPDAYRVIVDGVAHSFDSMYRARLFYDEALDAAEYEEELHNIRFVYQDYNPITGQIEWVEDYD